MKEDTTPIDPTWMSKTGGFARDMTLRDHYAGLAMQEIIGTRLNKEVPRDAYLMADAMLKAREGK